MIEHFMLSNQAAVAPIIPPTSPPPPNDDVIDLSSPAPSPSALPYPYELIDLTAPSSPEVEIDAENMDVASDVSTVDYNFDRNNEQPSPPVSEFDLNLADYDSEISDDDDDDDVDAYVLPLDPFHQLFFERFRIISDMIERIHSEEQQRMLQEFRAEQEAEAEDGDEDDNGEICAICLHKMKNPKKVDCNHEFCIKCIAPWLMDKRTCPLCRCEITTLLV